MEHSRKSFGTFRFTPDTVSMISKLSRDIGDSCTFEFFIILCLNDLLTFFVLTMNVLTDHLTSVLCNWAIRCPRFAEAFKPNYSQLKYHIEVNP